MACKILATKCKNKQTYIWLCIFICIYTYIHQYIFNILRESFQYSKFWYHCLQCVVVKLVMIIINGWSPLRNLYLMSVLIKWVCDVWPVVLAAPFITRGRFVRALPVWRKANHLAFLSAQCFIRTLYYVIFYMDCWSEYLLASTLQFTAVWSAHCQSLMPYNIDMPIYQNSK